MSNPKQQREAQGEQAKPAKHLHRRITCMNVRVVQLRTHYWTSTVYRLNKRVTLTRTFISRPSGNPCVQWPERHSFFTPTRERRAQSATVDSWSQRFHIKGFLIAFPDLSNSSIRFFVRLLLFSSRSRAHYSSLICTMFTCTTIRNLWSCPFLPQLCWHSTLQTIPRTRFVNYNVARLYRIRLPERLFHNKLSHEQTW